MIKNRVKHIALTVYNHSKALVDSKVIFWRKKYSRSISEMSKTKQTAIKEYFQESTTTGALKIQMKLVG